MTRSRTKGFTLIEVLIAAGIILIATVGVLYAFVAAQSLSEANHNLVVAVNDAQFVLEEIRALPYGSIATYAAPGFGSLNDEQILLTRSIGVKVAEVTVEVRWNERQRQRTISLTSRFAK